MTNNEDDATNPIAIGSNGQSRCSSDVQSTAAKVASSACKKRVASKMEIPNDLDVMIPSSASASASSRPFGSNGECTVLVQIDPKDSASLDLEGAVGAIGRIEVDSRGVVLDLKGCQYRGTLFPGPTALVMSLVCKKGEAPYLKVDGITDEFCRLTKTGDSMQKIKDAVEENALHFEYEEEDVNRKDASSKAPEEKVEKSGNKKKRPRR